MRDRVQLFRQIGVNNVRVASAHKPVHFLDCIDRAATRAISISAVLKIASKIGSSTIFAAAWTTRSSRSSEPKNKIDINNRLTNIENLERMEGIEPTPPVWKLLLNPRATPAKKILCQFHKDGRDFRVLMASFWNQR